MNENISAYISLEKGENGQEIISSYENTLYGNVCCGDIAIANEEIFEVNNPFFLSDTFVFCKKHLNVFLKGEVEMVCFIKVNGSNQIEEIGTDFVSRFHIQDFHHIMMMKDVRPANNVHKILFSLIGDEYWCGKYKDKNDEY